MYPLYLSITRSSSPLILPYISTSSSSEAFVLHPHNSIHPHPHLVLAPSLKVIDICLRPLPSLFPIASPSTPSSSALPLCYNTYSIMPSSLLPFHSSSFYVIVVNFKKSSDLRFIVIIPSTLSHLLHFILWPT
jgi:hypothetical protein